ncbi:50S ribosomal protein bL37 [Microtetraspora fusca]
MKSEGTGRTTEGGSRMGKRARKSKARKKKQSNHGKRPTGR